MTDKQLARFVQLVERKRRKKNLLHPEVFKTAHVSLRSWHQWTRELKEGESRTYPNEWQTVKVLRALDEMPARPKKIRGYGRVS